jgi:hypothetical protein
MRPGDVVQGAETDDPTYRCRGCDDRVRLRDAEQAGECQYGCCTDYRCPDCRHVTRVEWPD